VVDQAEKRSRSYEEELNTIFEETLRPLMSESARKIYVILVKSAETHLTTLDMQDTLKDREVTLSKKELNNWLSSLQSAGLVQKDPERGKPTTIPYSDKYTYDLWSLTGKGLETAQKLSIFTQETPTLNNVKTIAETSLPDLENVTEEQMTRLETLYLNMRTLRTLRDEVHPSPLKQLSAKSGISQDVLQEFIEHQTKSDEIPLYLLSEKGSGLGDKILRSLGLRRRRETLISLSSEGKRKAQALP
jgi:DNA-binding HxlR family transcriptional regulator